MNLQSTLERIVLQLKNQPRTLQRVARVFHLITTAAGLPVDFAITSADIDDREVVPVLCERGRYPILLGDKGYISTPLQDELLETEETVLLPTLRSHQKTQYPESFRKLQVRLRHRVETTIGTPHRTVLY